MNEQEYDKLSAQEKRIKVAELCGYDNIMHACGVEGGHLPSQCGRPALAWGELPDYLNDLNACHEFEKRMTEEQFQSYQHVLYAIVYGKELFDYTLDLSDALSHCSMLTGATAEQRCKAFVLTMEAE